MNAIEQPQKALDLRVFRQVKEDISDDIVAKQPSMLSAILLCVTASGIADKVICLELDVDPGHWSRIKKGDAHLPPDMITELMDICGNEIPLRWLAMKRGYGLVRLRSEVEAENETLRAQIDELHLKIEHFKEFLTAK